MREASTSPDDGVDLTGLAPEQAYNLGVLAGRMRLAAYREGWQARDKAMTVGRCWSCDHESAIHQPDGCWYTVTNGTVGRDLVCVCSEPRPVERLNADE